MTNKVILATGAISALAAIALLLSPGDQIDPEELAMFDHPVQQAEKTKSIPFKKVSIDYEASDHTDKRAMKNGNSGEKQAVQQPIAQKDEKPLPLGQKTYDASRTYTISLYDPDRMYKPSEAPRAKSFTYLEGTIDGNKFTMKVPDYLLESPENVKLSIRNRKTNATETIAASTLLDEMRYSPGTNVHKEVHLDSGSLDNYSYDESPIVTPPSPY